MEEAKHIIDGLSIGTIAAVFIGWLPVLSLLLTVIWSMIRIYETKTIQNWVHGKK